MRSSIYSNEYRQDCENDSSTDEEPMEDNSSDEEEDFEDLADIPDTREFMTSNVQGLEAMSFAGHGEGEFDIETDAE